MKSMKIIRQVIIATDQLLLDSAWSNTARLLAAAPRLGLVQHSKAISSCS